jgi:hypothetical protein
MKVATYSQELMGATARQCGDINLVAAIMSLGIPLKSGCPLTLTEGPGGKIYSSFRIEEYSLDMKIATNDLMENWSGVARIPLPADHGFSRICQFIRSRKSGIQNSQDLLDFAVDYLRERGHELPGLRKLSDIPHFVASLPTSEASYVLAYIANREQCFQLFSKAKRDKYRTAGQGLETRHALIDHKLPRWQKEELISRLQG